MPSVRIIPAGLGYLVTIWKIFSETGNIFSLHTGESPPPELFMLQKKYIYIYLHPRCLLS